MADGYDALTEILRNLQGQGGDGEGMYDAIMEQASLAAQGEAEFRDRGLAQRLTEIQMSESGANTRAGISASASRYSADASTKNAKIAAGATTRGQDIQKEIAQFEDATKRDLGYGEMGLQALELPTKYRGADDHFQQADLQRGLSARQDVPLYVQSLMNGGALSGYSMPGASPTGFSMQGVMNKLGTGGSGAPGAQGQDASALAAIRQLGARGSHTLAPGSLEMLSPGEIGGLRSGLEYSGDGGTAWDWDSWIKGYGNARIGQGDPRRA